MDPLATLNLIFSYLSGQEWDLASDSADDLIEWRQRGGFIPRGGDGGYATDAVLLRRWAGVVETHRAPLARRLRRVATLLVTN
tara:strand:- start:1527 stop:1775 length:249 start_codon:yes stop_codon:yes gene_type:complete